ncbi:MAG: YraN family protein [Chitinophagaceae bacterium]|nr:YraN family protein [Chitinophagaceae bacterium]
MNWNKDIGNKGEDIAANHLQQLGFEILERNWRFRKWEVDIIASKGKLLHFIEVKTRTNLNYGRPEESITYERWIA